MSEVAHGRRKGIYSTLSLCVRDVNVCVSACVCVIVVWSMRGCVCAFVEISL